MYNLVLRSVSTVDPLADKHPRLVRCLAKLRGAWACDIKKFGNIQRAAPLNGCTLSRGLPKGVRGDVTYFAAPGDRTKNFDDFIALRFDPQRQNVQELIDVVIPALIEETTPYVLNLTDEEISGDDWSMRIATGRWTKYGRLGVVSFLDAILCREAFGLTPAAVKKLLKPYVANVTASKAGVLIVLTRELLEKEDLRALGAAVRSQLPKSPFPATDPKRIVTARPAAAAESASGQVTRSRSGRRYFLDVRARPAGPKGWRDRHRRLIDCLIQLGGAWTCDPTRIEKARINDDEVRCILSALLPSGMKGEVVYPLHETNQHFVDWNSGTDSSHNDDRLQISFDAGVLESKLLIDTVIPR